MMQSVENIAHSKASNARYPIIDVARGIALLAMASYHFVYDLEMFALVEPGTAGTTPWKPYARCIASSFLMLVGFSLYLAHGQRANPLSAMKSPKWWKRFAMVAGAALIITIATYIAIRVAFIQFGILHQIALASVLGLFFLKLPALLLLALAAGTIALPFFYTTPALLGYHGWWTGLATHPPNSVDFVPLFPWFGAVLVGIALAKFATQLGWLESSMNWKFGNAPSRLLRLFGRNSLIFYLVHQPILLGALWLYLKITGKI